LKQDKKVPLPPGVGLRRPLHQPLQAPHRGFLLRGLRPPAHDGARLRDARVHHAVRPSGAADRGGCRLQPAVLFGRLLHGEPRRALPQDRHGQGEVVEEVEGRGRKGRGREEEEERHTTLQKTKKTRDFLERDLSSLHSLSLFSTPNAPRKTQSLAPCDLSLSTHCVRKKKSKRRRKRSAFTRFHSANQSRFHRRALWRSGFPRAASLRRLRGAATIHICTRMNRDSFTTGRCGQPLIRKSSVL